MKLVAQVQLKPAPEQAEALRQTMERANDAANAISAYAWESKTFRTFALHKSCYYDIKTRFSLTAEVVVRMLHKVGNAYKLHRNHECSFRPLGSIAYDDRILRWYDDSVSIWTVAGRARIPFVCGEQQRQMLAHRQGESDLVLLDGRFFLSATCNIEGSPQAIPTDWLGIDLGMVNIATTSDGEVMSGDVVNGLRHRHRRLRKRLQSKGTQSAKRLLKKRRHRESRFGRDVNHCISKRIVATAKDTKRGIAMEDLTHIHSRITARKPQRATLSSWSFAQLRRFVSYKARLGGVPVVFLDPRNTSRTCPVCGHCERANRKSQSCFLCVVCGFAGLADHIAAVNIRSRVAVMLPHAESVTASASRLL